MSPVSPAGCRRLCLLLAFTTLGAAGARAQDVPFEARVVDAATGAALPGATAQVAGTTRGATADAAGRVRLALPSLPDTVVVRFLGYATAQLVLTPADVREGRVARTVRLSAETLGLGEAVVSAEPPGERLWRRVLARREALARRVPTYAAESYTRLVLQRRGPLDAGPVPISLTEALANHAWTRAAGLREEVVARRRLPERGPFRYAGLNPTPDLYLEDALALDGRRIPSPTAPDALDHYAFRLGETVEADGRRYLDLAVIPRRGGLLAGRIRVVDTLLVVAEAELRLDPGPRAPPVADFEATYRWTYAPVYTDRALGDSLWLPARFEREGAVTVGLALARVPTVRFRQTTVFTLVVPRSPGAVPPGAPRFRSPAAVFAGREAFLRGRDALPPDSVMAAVEGNRRLRTMTWAELLPRQTGLGFALPLLGSVGVPLEGADE